MKFFYVFLILLYSLNMCCFGQKWDINIKFRLDSLGKYNYTNNYLQNTGEYDKTKKNSLSLAFSLTKYINTRDKYYRLSIGVTPVLYHHQTKSLINNKVVGITENYLKKNVYYGSIEHGLSFQWNKFLILLGGGICYDYIGKYTMYKFQEGYIEGNITNTYNGLKMVQSHLPSHVLGLYNGNALYYTFYKHFYTGLDIRNTVKWRFSNTIGESTTYILDESHNTISQSYSNITIYEKRIRTTLLDTFFSLGVRW